MIRTFTVASLIALGFAGAASAETRTYDVGSFTAIDISAGLDLNLSKAPQGLLQSRIKKAITAISLLKCEATRSSSNARKIIGAGAVSASAMISLSALPPSIALKPLQALM